MATLAWRTKPRRIAQGALTVALFGAVACGEGPHEPQRLTPCLTGLPKAVQDSCACGEFQRRLDVALLQTHLPELAISATRQCMNGNVNAVTVGASVLASDVSGCLDRRVDLDPGIKSTLIAIVASSLSSSSEPISLDLQRTWQRCYASKVNPPAEKPQMSERYAQEPIVLAGDAKPNQTPDEALGTNPYKFWLFLKSPLVLPDVKEVVWYLEQPALKGLALRSTDSLGSFGVTYEGSNCLDKIAASITFLDGSRLVRSFNQCKIGIGVGAKGEPGSSEITEGEDVDCAAYAARGLACPAPRVAVYDASSKPPDPTRPPSPPVGGAVSQFSGPLTGRPPPVSPGQIPITAKACTQASPAEDLAASQCRLVCWDAKQTKYNVDKTKPASSVVECATLALGQCRKAGNSFCAYAWAAPH